MFEKDKTAFDELREISPLLAGYDKKMPFELPDVDWMHSFTELLVEKTKLHPHLPGNEEIFAVPEKYFQELPNQILRRIGKQEVENELAEISPMLLQFERRLPYSPPANNNAFKQATIVQSAEEKRKSVIVKIFSAKFVRYAAAACILAASLTFVMKLVLQKEINTEKVQLPNILSEKDYDELLASIDEQSIIDYLQKEGIQISQADLETYVEADVLPEDIEYFDPELSEDFFESIEQELMNDSIPGHE
jgi:hypothetical protein